MTTLFDLPETLSPRLRWMKEHGFITCFIDVADRPWSAFIPMADQVLTGNKAADLWLHSEKWQPLVGEGNSEDDAIIDCAKKRGLRLWNETEVGGVNTFAVGLRDTHGIFCWLTDGEGDPPRSYNFKHALRFETYLAAETAIAAARETHPCQERTYSIVPVAHVVESEVAA